MDEQNFYIATRDRKGDFLIYSSDKYKLSEIDLINLIKILIIERRSQKIGERVLDIYRDSTIHKKDEVQQKLSLIGIKDNGDNRPVSSKRPNQR